MENNNNLDQMPASVLVIFGSTGNLAEKKLIPALYHLQKGKFLPKDFNIIFVARDKTATTKSIIAKAKSELVSQEHSIDEDTIELLIEKSSIIYMDSTKQEDYYLLKNELDSIDLKKSVKHNRLYYLAIPPNIFPTVIGCLGATGLNKDSDNTARRILVEKPFGTDLESAKQLIGHINKYFDEDQVYRIDHYLAKETAQNILTFRFNNPLIEGLWDRQFIDHIQITASETIDIEGRSNFYDDMGALRDLVQSHLLQLMALTTMEVPEVQDSANIHIEKLALLNSIKSIKPNHVAEVVFRGQYKGYRQEAGNDQSNTETFVALHLEVANSRWGGVPILVRTGKALASKVTEITLVFKDRSRRSVPANLLTIRIQPNEGISIELQAKKPGFGDELQKVDMDFCYQTSFDGVQPDAYEHVLMDSIIGDQSLFATSAEVLKCWEILDPILTAWKHDENQPDIYEKGSWGPESANELADNYGCKWLSNLSHVCAVHPKHTE
ncbi:glucose-6-phosphate dehydrogenase [Candidatus Saccharibacteria bacterium]|nr:glucose-6-phosphate dehydrogenase [Candidatus Saccharibacteria bacterium]